MNRNQCAADPRAIKDKNLDWKKDEVKLVT